MRHTSSASVSFDVGHVTSTPTRCERVHGHKVTIEIAMTGRPVAEYGSYVVEPDLLFKELASIERELSRRDLGEMTAPAKPTAAGLAGWVWERLALEWADFLVYVDVRLDGLGARIDA